MNTFYLLDNEAAVQQTAQTVQETVQTEVQSTQTTQAVTEQPDPAKAAQQQGKKPQGNGWSMWLILALFFVVMWLFMIRPQRKQQKQMEEFRNSLKKGDKVVTVGGIYGEIVEVGEKTVLIKVDGDTKLRVDKAGLVKDYSEAQQL